MIWRGPIVIWCCFPKTPALTCMVPTLFQASFTEENRSSGPTRPALATHSAANSSTDTAAARMLVESRRLVPTLLLDGSDDSAAIRMEVGLVHMCASVWWKTCWDQKESFVTGVTRDVFRQLPFESESY